MYVSLKPCTFSHTLISVCSEISEDVLAVAAAACVPSPTSTLSPPSHHGKGTPLAVKSFKGIDDWELAPEHRVLGECGLDVCTKIKETVIDSSILLTATQIRGICIHCALLAWIRATHC